LVGVWGVMSAQSWRIRRAQSWFVLPPVTGRVGLTPHLPGAAVAAATRAATTNALETILADLNLWGGGFSEEARARVVEGKASFMVVVRLLAVLMT
jgi:hypothetical protein